MLPTADITKHYEMADVSNVPAVRTCSSVHFGNYHSTPINSVPNIIIML